MNRNQVIGVCIASVAVFLAFKFPPYYNDGGLIGGTVYFPFQKPPSDPSISFNCWLLGWEVSFVGLSLWAALIALKSGARRRQKIILFVGLAVEMVFLACSLPGFRTILGPEFTWYLLNVLGVVLLAMILLSRFRREQIS